MALKWRKHFKFFSYQIPGTICDGIGCGHGHCCARFECTNRDENICFWVVVRRKLWHKYKTNLATLIAFPKWCHTSLENCSRVLWVSKPSVIMLKISLDRCLCPTQFQSHFQSDRQLFVP